MEIIYFFALVFGFSIATKFARFKLTKWEYLFKIYGTDVEPKGEQIYGFFSEYRAANTNYPLSNNFLKIIPTYYGMYIKYDLKYEVIRFFKRVLIPWQNIKLIKSTDGVDYDRFEIARNGIFLIGTLSIQPFITVKLQHYLESIGKEIQEK